MKKILFYLLILGTFQTHAQKTESEVQQIRDQHLADLMDTSKHILNTDEIANFHGLDYFEFDEKYQITATFIKDKGRKFEMITSTNRRPIYRRYGYVQFAIHNATCKLEVYQNMSLKKHKDYLFIPFRDGSSGKSSYGGGRYLDITIPEGDSVLLDFNLLYNPYCAYSYRYSCPIPPEANKLSISIEAGEKTPPGH